MKGRAWSATEDELLRREFESSTIADLARRLGRTPKAVRYRLAVLGLRRNGQGRGQPQFRRRLITIRDFCADCAEDPFTCRRDVRECMAEADVYFRLFDCTDDEPRGSEYRAIVC